MKLEVYRYIFEKYSNIKFHENFPLGAQPLHADWWKDGLVRVYGQTDKWKDGNDEANSRFTQFCKIS
jgi:hypothetical protein